MVEKPKASSRRKAKSDNRVRDERTEERIREKAYEIYENRGRKQGKALDDWLEAEMIISQDEGK
jgi:hypothetical protein